MLDGRFFEVETHTNDARIQRSLAESGAENEVVANKKCYLWVVYQANDPLLKVLRDCKLRNCPPRSLSAERPAARYRNLKLRPFLNCQAT